MRKVNKYSVEEIIYDINSIVSAIDDQVDTFLVSRTHKNPKIRILANNLYLKKRKQTHELSLRRINKYGR